MLDVGFEIAPLLLSFDKKTLGQAKAILTLAPPAPPSAGKLRPGLNKKYAGEAPACAGWFA